MKYCLRSSSTDLETNQISSTVSQKEFQSNKNKISKKPKKSTKSRKLIKRQKKDKNDKPIKSKKITNHKVKSQRYIIHEKIMRFPLKHKKSTLRVYCYKQSDLGIKRRFSRRFMSHKKDDDQQSWDSLIESQVERCKNALFDSVRKYSEALSQKSIANPTEKEPQNDEIHQATEQRDKCKKKKRITKRKKNN